MPSRNFYSKFEYKPITKFLKEKAEDLKDLSPLMKLARVFLKNVVNKNFETEGNATGDKWQAWTEEYKKQRLKKGKSGKILTLEGHLRQDLRAKSGPDFAQVGFNKEYAAIHNFGGTIETKFAKIKMPKRELMRLSDYNKEELLAELYLKAEEIMLEGSPKQ